MRAEQGDWLVVESPHTGQSRRKGRIVQANGPDGSPPYLVRWNNTDQESLVFPGPDAHLERAEDTAES
jgi:hypothetical protein